MEIEEVDKAISKVTEKVVVALVGEWLCSEVGAWHFIVEKNCMAQCIYISSDTTYSQLRFELEKEFEVEGKAIIKKLAYRLPAEMSIFGTAKTPHVSINTDSGLATFLKLKASCKAMNLFVTFDASHQRGENEKRKPILIEEGSIIRLGGVSPTFSTADLIGQACQGRPETEDQHVHNVRPVTVEHLTVPEREDHHGHYIDPHTLVQVGEGEEEVNGRNMEIDLNNIYDDQMIAELEKIEAQAKEQHGWKTTKGKEKVVNANKTADDQSDEEWEPYGTSEEMDYNYDYWHTLISREYAMVTEGDHFEVGEPSNTVRLQILPLTEAEAINLEEQGLQHMNVESEDAEEGGGEEGGSEAGVFEQSDAEQEIQPSLANIYNEILEAESVSAPDCEPCFGDQLLQTQDMKMGVFDPANDVIYIGRVFRNKADMQTALATYAIKRVFNFKQIKSDKDRLIVRCVDNNCRWRVYGHKVGEGSENIEIRTARLTHTCNVETRAEFGKKATCKVVAQVLQSKYSNGKIGPRAVDIPAIVLDEMKVSISYMRAWHAKEKAVREARGTEEGSYGLLMAYLKLLKETNEGTVTDVVCTNGGTPKAKFKYLFFALGACIKAVEFMRKVLIVDATAIKAKFKGTFITASFQDGNFQIMPVGFGIVDGENDRSWSWFFQQLSKFVADSEDLVFVSDRHNSIYTALRCVYPLAKHGSCAVHLYKNIKARFRKQKGLPLLVSQAAFAYTVQEFKNRFSEIEGRSPLCATYLRGIGISHWTRAYFQGKRYNIMSSNVAESLNAALAKALEFPIVSMVEAIRMMIMRWFYERRTKSYKHGGPVTEEVEKILMKNLTDSADLNVYPASNSVYQVNSGQGDPFSVNLERRSCTCRVFDILGIPCRHAMAAARVIGIPVHALVDEFYSTKMWQDAYSNVVMPVPNVGDNDEEDGNENNIILPPQTKQPPGRPRKRRIPSVGENIPSQKRRTRSCSRCGGVGHNRATCTYGIP